MALPIPRGGHERVTPLWLYPEIDCSSCVADVEDQSGAGQLAYYVDYLQRHFPEWWDADAVPIGWSVRGEGIWEYAPNDPDEQLDENFLTFWSRPRDAKTGEPLNWWRLPLRNDRFLAFAKALGWLPSPFQATAPIRSIVTNATRRVRSLEPRKEKPDDGQAILVCRGDGKRRFLAGDPVARPVNPMFARIRLGWRRTAVARGATIRRAGSMIERMNFMPLSREQKREARVAALQKLGDAAALQGTQALNDWWDGLCGDDMAILTIAIDNAWKETAAMVDRQRRDP
jgi:hypothetical protein